MRRWLVVAALGAVFVALPLWGQRRGGISGGFGGHAGIAARGAVGGMRGPAMGFHRPGFADGPHTGFRPGFGRGPFFGNRFHHHRPWWGWGGYGYPWWGGWYGDLDYDWGYPDNSYAAQSYPAYSYPPDSYAQNDVLAEQVGRLSDEVARLREERQAQSSTPSTAPAAAQPEPTELIFRDQHTEEVHNYAIVGPTLWILGEQRTRKIALAELDVPATVKANEDRGVEFQLPR